MLFPLYSSSSHGPGPKPVSAPCWVWKGRWKPKNILKANATDPTTYHAAPPQSRMSMAMTQSTSCSEAMEAKGQVPTSVLLASQVVCMYSLSGRLEKKGLPCKGSLARVAALGRKSFMMCPAILRGLQVWYDGWLLIIRVLGGSWPWGWQRGEQRWCQAAKL